MDKYILISYSDALARVKYLRGSIENLETKLSRMNRQGYYVADSVTTGKKGKKPLGSVTVVGFPYPAYDHIRKKLIERKEQLEQEEQKLLELTNKAEEYIGGLKDVEIRNILSLYYIEDLNWVQVAHRMNALYNRKKKYTDSSCRCKHDRFMEKS